MCSGRKITVETEWIETGQSQIWGRQKGRRKGRQTIVSTGKVE